jgi:hypothetical protein
VLLVARQLQPPLLLRLLLLLLPLLGSRQLWLQQQQLVQQLLLPASPASCLATSVRVSALQAMQLQSSSNSSSS